MTNEIKGLKYDINKPRLSLLPPQSLWGIVDVLEYGANKYRVDNWKHVDNARERYFNACMRHIYAWFNGYELDDESGLPHLAHAICCLIFLLELS